MKRKSSPPKAMRRQRGMSLIVVLLLLIITTVLGVGAASLSLVNEKGARNDRDLEVAFQAAEAALLDAQLDITGPKNPSSNARLCAFSEKGDVSAFKAGCGEGAVSRGLCLGSPAGDAPAWLGVSFASDDARSVELGTFTGEAYMTADKDNPRGASTARRPRYVIEALPNNGGYAPNELVGAGADQRTYLFRATAIGYGVRAETQVVLQGIVRKFNASPGC